MRFIYFPWRRHICSFLQNNWPFKLENQLDIFALIGIAAAYQAVFLGLYLLFRPGKGRTASKLLGGLLLMFAFSLTHDLLAHTRYMLQWPHFFGTGPAFLLAIGPMAYFYVRFSAKKGLKFQYLDMLHFLPFALLHLQRLDTYLMPVERKVRRLAEAFSNEVVPSREISFWQVAEHFMIWHLQPLIYYLLSLGVLAWHARAVKQQYSYTESISLRWMQFTLYGLLFIWLMEYLLELYFAFSGSTGLSAKSVSLLLYATYILMLNLMALEQYRSGKPVGSKPKNIYAGQSKDDAECERQITALKQFVEEKKPFLDHSLSLSELSEQLGISSRKLSFLINSRMDQNFYDFINQYRAAYAATLLQDSNYQQHYTIAAIGESSGFKSRDTFYRSFRKCYGQTPRQYQKGMKENS